MLLVGSDDAVTNALDNDSGALAVLLPLLAALLVGVAAQTWINQMIKGDQGLGAFLKDGQGFNKSGFRQVVTDESSNRTDDDPLPWLSLPKLDFVDVAGQEDPQQVLVEDELERLRSAMTRELQAGNLERATELKNELMSWRL
jgi:hypothetical protein